MMEFSSKVVVCLVVVLGNAGIWGDASIETVLAQSSTHSSNLPESKDCSRPCKLGAKPRRCVYDVRISPLWVQGAPFLSLNGRVPGPALSVCARDVLEVRVRAPPAGTEPALHWHGQPQRASPHMDGVPMVTQCSAPGGGTFKYVFRADEPGTHFYHAHSVNQQLSGVLGALIVRQPAPLEPPAARGARAEKLVLVSVQPALNKISVHDEHGEDLETMVVEEGHKYRMRVINGVPVDCPLVFSVDQHMMTVVASDGRAVQAENVTSFMLYPGERFDFMLTADQRPSTYVFSIQGRGVCQKLFYQTLVVYAGSNSSQYTSPEGENLIEDSSHATILSGQHLLSWTSPPAALTASPIKSTSLRVDANTIDVTDESNEYRYLSDVKPVPVFYPAQLTMHEGPAKVVQINGKSFLYPNAPLLHQHEDILTRTLCPVGYEDRYPGVECVQVLDVDYKNTLELIIVDEGFGSDTDKVFHLHGNPMYVLATSKSFNKPIRMEDVEKMDYEGRISRNLVSPPRKDTIVVPNKGFVIVRILADSPGAWLLECRTCSHQVASLPTAIVISVGQKLPDILLDTLPRCGNYKPADTLLH